MAAKRETDAEVYERLMKDRDTRRGIDALAWEMRQGDATTRKRAEHGLRGLGMLAREVAAIKRWIKRSPGGSKASCTP